MVEASFDSLDDVNALVQSPAAQAITATAPPRGTLRVNGEWVSGRLYGPALLPTALSLVREIKKQTALPMIGAGGVHSKADVEAMLEAGATAVMVDSVVWVDPEEAVGLIQPGNAE